MTMTTEGPVTAEAIEATIAALQDQRARLLAEITETADQLSAMKPRLQRSAEALRVSASGVIAQGVFLVAGDDPLYQEAVKEDQALRRQRGALQMRLRALQLAAAQTNIDLHTKTRELQRFYARQAEIDALIANPVPRMRPRVQIFGARRATGPGGSRTGDADHMPDQDGDPVDTLVDRGDGRLFNRTRRQAEWLIKNDPTVRIMPRREGRPAFERLDEMLASGTPLRVANF